MYYTITMTRQGQQGIKTILGASSPTSRLGGFENEGAPSSLIGAGDNMKTKNAQHTKGPWNLEKHAVELCYLVRNDEYGMATLATVSSGKREDGTSGDANARLIAAAPDLLAACQEALDYLGRIDEGSEGCELRDSLRAAIAKAEGREVKP